MDKSSNNSIENRDRVSEKLIGISKDEALQRLGLTCDANEFAIDDKFWKLSKKISVIEDDSIREQEMTDLVYLYDVATGKEQRRIEESNRREKARKFFGKTSEEWKVYIGYTWYKYLIALVLLILIASVTKQMLFAKDIDFTIVSVGNFEVDVGILEDQLIEKGYSNPYSTFANLVVPNDEGAANGSYAEMTSSVVFVSNPDIVITDERTCCYFYNQMDDISTLYNELRAELSPEVFETLVPVYCSEYDAALLSIEYLESLGRLADREELNSCSRNQVMIGIEITDEDFISSLGYTNLWPKTKPTMVISYGNHGIDRAGAQRIIKEMLSSLS